MKMVDGEPLNHIIKEIKKGTPHYVDEFSIFDLLNVFRKICDAIAFAHSKDIIHQDIKPHNVIVGQYGEVMVMDWGLARYIGDPEKEEDPAHREILKDISTAANGDKKIIQGSPAYMAPEQVKADGTALDKQTDIFLLGTTLYHMLTLEPPYEGESILDVLNKAEQRDMIPPQIRNPERLIPEELCRIITKATALKKEDRYYSVQELIADVDDIISGKWSKQEKKYFACDEFLMQEGEPGEEAYLITKGSVQVFKESGSSKVVLTTLHEGDIVGEMALITNDNRSASVKALEDTEVAVLTKQHLARNLKKLPPYIEKIVSTITRRLQAADMFIHPHLTMECTPFVLQQLYLILKSEAADKKMFMVSIDKIAARIADDLGVPVARVEKVFLNAAEANLFSIKQDRIMIEDINKIIRAARWAKSMIGK
jgi:serine/threonine-protein kinase